MDIKPPLSYQLNHLVDTMNKSADIYLRKTYGFGYSRFIFLITLLNIEEVTQHSLAQAMGVSDAVVSRMIPPLIDQDYISVRTNPNHGRQKLVELTDNGKKTVEKIAEKLEASFQHVVAQSQINESRLHKDVEKLINQIHNEGEIQ